MQRKTLLRQFRFILPIGLAILFISSPAGAEDIYSVDLVASSYIEANNVIPNFYGDGLCTDVPLPFPFTFYKKEYTHAWVALNGYLSFAQCTSMWNNAPLPTPYPNGAIFAFWDDLSVDRAEGVRTLLLGTAPNQQFVIEWRNVRFWNDRSKRIDFEIVLHENGVILLQYRNIDNNPLEMGGSATVGIEDETGANVVQYGGAIGPGEYAIRFADLPRTVQVPVDIKPGACPKPFNIGSQGVLPVAILGTPDFDVTTIDPNSVTLGGGSTLSNQANLKKVKILVSKQSHRGWSLQDVGGTPDGALAAKIDPNQCNELGPDGRMDILFKFDAEAIAASLGKSDVVENQEVTLQLRGHLKDEKQTPIIGQGVVIIKGAKEKKNK